MKKMTLILLTIMLLPASLYLLSCGDSSTDGQPRNNWEINVLLARNGETGFVNVYAEIFKNDAAYPSAVLKIDDLVVPSEANGHYVVRLSPSSLSDTSEISITTSLESFQFMAAIVVPDTFSFNFDQLPDNQVFSSTDVVSVHWNGSDFKGMTGGYFIVTEPTSSVSTAVGSFDLFAATQGSIPRDAFRDSQGNFQLGAYNVWVVSRIEQPINSPNIPFTIPSGVFSQNVERVGVTGQIGAIYISPRKTVTAVAGQ
ncbi:MAG: hypothetical protein WBP29_09325 [Candidatus Zixiibacteriota bacterium]